MPGSFTNAPILDSVAAGLFATLIGLVVVIAATGGVALLAGSAILALGACTGLMSFVHWWLYTRLMCLGGERCAVGVVLSVEPPSKKGPANVEVNDFWDFLLYPFRVLFALFGRLDSDYTFNLMLPGVMPGAKLPEASAGIDGDLVAPHPAVTSRVLPYRVDDQGNAQGYAVLACDTAACPQSNCPATVVLHCEFEGAGMYKLYQWLKPILAALILATVGTALCWIPFIGWVICAVAGGLLALAAAAFLAGMVHALSDSASPSDVDPALGGELHQNDCSGKGADIVAVTGEWVYDSLHDGWNELHPIIQCVKIGTWSGQWPPDVQAMRDTACKMLADARSSVTLALQGLPQNQWEHYPAIDGCLLEGEEDDSGGEIPLIK